MHDEHLFVSPHRGSSYLPSAPSSDAYLGEDRRVTLAKPEFVRRGFTRLHLVPTYKSFCRISVTSWSAPSNESREDIYYSIQIPVSRLSIIYATFSCLNNYLHDESWKITENFVKMISAKWTVTCPKAIINISFLFFFTISVKVPILLARRAKLAIIV